MQFSVFTSFTFGTLIDYAKKYISLLCKFWFLFKSLYQKLVFAYSDYYVSSSLKVNMSDYVPYSQLPTSLDCSLKRITDLTHNSSAILDFYQVYRGV